MRKINKLRIVLSISILPFYEVQADGCLFLRLLNYSSNYEKTKYSAENNGTVAQAMLGMWYLDGNDDVTKDNIKGLYWLQKSAEQGETSAQECLGM